MQRQKELFSRFVPFKRNLESIRYFPIFLILLFSVAFYAFKLGSESLAEDEFYSLRDAGNLNPVALRVRPAFYLILHVWMQLGNSEAWLRGLSVVFSVASIFLIFWLGRRLLNNFAGLTAAVLLMLSPLHISNAQEIRMYMVSLCFGLAGTVLFVSAMERPSNKHLAGWATFRLLGNLTYPLSVTLLFADALLWCISFRKEPKKVAVFGFWLALVGILWLPFFLNLLSATQVFMGGWIDVVPVPAPRDVIGLLKVFTIRWWSWLLTSSPSVIGQLSQQLDRVYFTKIYTLLALGMIIFGLRYWKRSPKIGWVLAWSVIPLGAIYLYSQSGKSLWVDRYLLFASPYCLLLLAFGFTQLWRHQRQFAIVCALIYAISVGGGLYEYYGIQEKDDWRSAIQQINAGQNAGDVIVTYTDAVSFDYYYEGENPIYEIPGEALDIGETLTPDKIETAFEQYVPAFDSRLWLLYRHRGSHERHPVVRSVIESEFDVHEKWSFQGIDLFLVSSSES